MINLALKKYLSTFSVIQRNTFRILKKLNKYLMTQYFLSKFLCQMLSFRVAQQIVKLVFLDQQTHASNDVQKKQISTFYKRSSTITIITIYKHEVRRCQNRTDFLKSFSEFEPHILTKVGLCQLKANSRTKVILSNTLFFLDVR